MFSSFPTPFSLFSRRSGTGSEAKPIKLPPVQVHNVETLTESRIKRLHSLLKLNHANHAIIYNHLRFHNHAPHILSSAYILGATTDQLNTIYDVENESLEPWSPSPGEISKDDWRDYLGKREYQRAYIDFFEDQLLHFGYDWKRLLEYYLFEGKEPLVNTLVSGLGHPLIHLGYAYEMNSGLVGIEALGLATCFYSDLHKYIDDPSYTKPSEYRSSSVFEILQKISEDTRFEGLMNTPAGDDIEVLVMEHEHLILEYWNAWDVDESNLQDRFAEAQHSAVALVTASKHRNPAVTGWEKNYDFFLLHALTSSHALRILLPILPGKYHMALVRQWFLFGLMAYVGQMRPIIDPSAITNFKPKEGEDSWKYVHHVALNGNHATDAHFVKGLRAMQVAEETWGSQEGYWLRAACKMAKEFDGWGGFSE